MSAGGSHEVQGEKTGKGREACLARGLFKILVYPQSSKKSLGGFKQGMT